MAFSKCLRIVSDGRCVCTHESWISRRCEILNDSGEIPGLHLAVFVEPFLSFLLDGRKTIESRFSIHRRAPFESITDEFLLRYCLPERPIDGISAATNQILSSRGNVRVTDLAREAGLSVRQFQRCFAQQVGVHPKLHARIVRFEGALDSKARYLDKSWTDVALDFGYYDQMHMIHDFEGFTSGTPTNILKEMEDVFRHEIEAVRQGRRLISEDNLELIL